MGSKPRRQKERRHHSLVACSGLWDPPLVRFLPCTSRTFCLIPLSWSPPTRQKVCWVWGSTLGYHLPTPLPSRVAAGRGWTQETGFRPFPEHQLPGDRHLEEDSGRLTGPGGRVYPVLSLTARRVRKPQTAFCAAEDLGPTSSPALRETLLSREQGWSSALDHAPAPRHTPAVKGPPSVD